MTISAPLGSPTNESTTADSTTGEDWFAAAAGIEPSSHAATLRDLRPDIVELLQANFVTLIAPAEPGGLSHIERGALAVRAAQESGSSTLAAAYRRLLIGLGVDESTVDSIGRGSGPEIQPERLSALVAHAELLSTEPRLTTADDIARLRAVGVAESDIVTATLIVGFVTYQVRAIRGLELLAAAS